MNITEIMRDRMTTAMKERNKKDRDFYAYVVGELELARKSKQNSANPNPILTEQEEIQVIASLSNKSKKAIIETKEKVNGAITEELNAFFAEKEWEISIYSEFLPKQMTEEEINETIKNIASSMATPINKGLLMKELMPVVKGKADGKLVSQIVEKFLKM